MLPTVIGIADFQDQFPSYAHSPTPVEVTEQRETIGIYLPLKPRPGTTVLEELARAGAQVRQMLAAAGTSEEEILAEVKRMRAAARSVRI